MRSRSFSDPTIASMLYIGDSEILSISTFYRIMASPAFLIIVSSILFSFSGALAAKFTLANNCAYTVWPGVLSGAGTAALSTTGFALQPGGSRTIDAPAGWSGRFWGRTLCSTDASGKFTCATGDCGSSAVECAGGGAEPPVTLAEFTLDGSGGMDFYDVSLVDGYNLPMLVVPRGGSGRGCGSTGCAADLNGLCPAELRVVAAAGDGEREDVACRSACEAFGEPQYCCSGAYGNPDTCKPTPYSQFFKKACPRAYSYAYDDATSTFTCAGADYLITFCPSTTSQKSSDSNAGGKPSSNDTIVYLGSEQGGGAAPRVPVMAAALLSASLAFLAPFLGF